MKKLLAINGHLFLAILALVGTEIIALSCGNENDPKKMANEYNDDVYDDRDEEKDAEFMVEVADINMTEIKLGELAQTKSTMPDVVALGKMMVKDHTQALNQLKAMARKKDVKLPEGISAKGQDHYDDLNELSGKDFDMKYCDMMINGHKDAIRLFENNRDRTEDSEVKTWASNTLPRLNMHLDHSRSCEEKCKSMY